MNNWSNLFKTIILCSSGPYSRIWLCCLEPFCPSLDGKNGTEVQPCFTRIVFRRFPLVALPSYLHMRSDVVCSAAKCHYQCHKKIWLKQIPYQCHVLNCENQRWYSERLVWLIHAHDMFATIAWSVTISRLFFVVINFAKYHWKDFCAPWERERVKGRAGSKLLHASSFRLMIYNCDKEC